MPFMAGEGACPYAPSSPQVRRSSERSGEAWRNERTDQAT